MRPQRFDMAHAESNSGGGSTAIVAIVAIVILAAIALFVFRGGFGRSGSAGSGPGIKGNVEVKVPTSGGGQK
jgi:hypothetical protein